MDIGNALAALYDPAMRACGWTRAQRVVRTGTSGSILDVGCGPARLANGSHEHYVGVDRRMAMLSQGPGGTTLVCADAAALPFGDGTFDTVVSTALLGLCLPAERRPILREMARVCLKGKHKPPLRADSPYPHPIHSATMKKGEPAGRQCLCHRQRKPRPFRPYRAIFTAD